MNAKDLRIGNLVRQVQYHNGYCNEIRSVTAIREEGSLNVRVIGAHNMKSHPIEWFIPILLTEEWLLKFGFVYSDYSRCFENSSICVDKDGEVGTYDSEYKVSEHTTTVKYVHQLQNLFYCLTGKELICD